MKLPLLLSLLIISFQTQGADFDKFAQAIHNTESSGKTGAIKGDYNSKTGQHDALGPLQIRKECWLDVKEKIGGSYKQVMGLSYSKRVLYFYLLRYEPTALKNKDWEKCARTWNGGPNWRKKKHLTNNYWKKVKKSLI